MITQTTAARWATGAVRVISLLLGCLLIVAVLLNFANVLGRYMFSSAIVGAEEIQVFIMVWIAFIGTAVVAWRHEHLRMDVVVQRLPLAVRAALKWTEAVLLAALALFMLYQSSMFTLDMIALGRNSDALEAPMAIPHSGLVLGFLLLAAVALLRLFGIRKPEDREAEADAQGQFDPDQETFRS